MKVLSFLLPAAERFGGQSFGEALANALGKADCLSMGEAGRRAQLQRHLQLPDGHWPIAALSRQADVGDAASAIWLRADPAWLQPDINGVRMMAFGPALSPTAEDCEALLPALQPIFTDLGFQLDAPSPDRWYIRAPLDAVLPHFPDPGDALGEDLFETDERENTPEARRWRALATEVQIVLHNHPWNQQRAAQGKAPINALWFWGAGRLPQSGSITSPHTLICTDDASLRALAASTCSTAALPQALDAIDSTQPSVLVDLTHDTDLRRIEQHWLLPALARLQSGESDSLQLDCEDGQRWRITRNQRWRFWRTPRQRLAS